MKKDTTDQTEVTTTTLETILKDADLITFHKAQETWDSMNSDGLKMLNKMVTVGTALNILYSQGETLNLKREAITELARESFPGLERRERSEYRKLAGYHREVKAYVEEYSIRSGNPTYLVNSYLKAVKDDCEACKQIEKYKAGGLDAAGNVFGAATNVTARTATGGSIEPIEPEVVNTKTMVDTPKIKEGFTNIVKPVDMSSEEVTKQLGYIINQVKTLKNQGKLDFSDTLTIEKHLTSCLESLNSVNTDEVELKMFG
jgi:hypothetical protein